MSSAAPPPLINLKGVQLASELNSVEELYFSVYNQWPHHSCMYNDIDGTHLFVNVNKVLTNDVELFQALDSW